LTGRRADLLESLAAEVHGRAISADLSRPEEAERLARDAEPVDILVANAGVQGGGDLRSFDAESVDTVLNVNLRAPIVLAQTLMAGMAERGRGQIVFMSSLSGKVTTPRTALYNATKFGLRGFAHALRADLRPAGVGVSVICPGFIREAGMFAKSGVKLPPGVGTSSPGDVARAVVRAIERNRAEIDVAPLPMRLSAAFGGLAPETAATITRISGGDRIGEQLAGAHRP
ncbi:MAG: SDR family NAD(P)-dependent oxidoreductase, partial [Acidobacteriota bacterium]|nr:SDR family NAD(P)-dependent oxidoreductase [Acidobacteriota bacterium]